MLFEFTHTPNIDLIIIYLFMFKILMESIWVSRQLFFQSDWVDILI